MPPEGESETERLARNFAELLQELRVAGLGVQVLFGFMLALPFSARFGKVSTAQRELYLGVLVVAALAIVLLGAPVALHRIVFRHHEREAVLRASNVLAIAGLGAVALAVSGAVLLVASVTSAGSTAAAVSAVVGAAFAVAWFLAPIWLRLRAPR